MSFYNMIFGESESADALLAALGLTRDDFYRYRDCYLDEQGRIAVYTRGGGGNRDCYCGSWGRKIKEPVEFEGKTHERRCVVLFHHTNRQHPCYLFDCDDEFDSTYATFYFRIPDEADRDKLAAIRPEIARNDAWVGLITALNERGGRD